MEGISRRSGFLATGALTLAFALPAQPVAQEAKLQPEIRAGGYGQKVRFAGSYLVVSERGVDSTSARMGAVHVLVYDGAEWRSEAIVRPDTDHSDSGFGNALTVIGDQLLVGEPLFPSPLRFSGRVQVVPLATARPGATRPTLQVPNSSLQQAFGAAVAASAELLVIGAPGASTNNGATGTVSVFERRDDSWELAESGPLTGAGAGDSFGSAVEVNERWIVVGAPGADSDTGTVAVWDRSNGCCEPVATLRPDLETPTTGYGAALALVGDLLVVGAPGRDTTARGAVELWRLDGGQPRRTARLDSPFPVDSRYGQVVATDGAVLAIGAPAADTMGPGSGAVQLYRLDAESGAVPARRLAVPSVRGGDAFGSSLAIDAGRLAIGAPGTEAGHGAVYVYGTAAAFEQNRAEFELLAHPGEGIFDPRINAMVEAENGLLLLGTLGGGLEIYDGRHFSRAVDTPGHVNVLAARRDRRGEIWVGTETGLYRLNRRSAGYERVTLEANVDGGEPVVAVFEASNGALWAGTNGRLFRRPDGAHDFEEYAPFFGPPTANDETYVSGIQEDSHGTIWVLAKSLLENRASLYAVNPESDLVQRHPLDPRWAQVGPLLIDSQDRLWIKAPEPLQLPLPAGPVAAPVPPVDAQHWALAETRNGDVWIATERGVYRRLAGSASTELQRIAPWAAPQQPWDFTRSVFETSRGELLFGTHAGVYRARSSASGPSTGRVALTRAGITGSGGVRVELPSRRQRLALASDDYRVEFRFAVVDYSRRATGSLRYQLEGFDRDWVTTDTGAALYTDLPPGDFTFRVESVGSGTQVAPLSLPVSIETPYWATWWFRSGLAIAVGALAVAGLRYRRARRAEVEALRLRIARDLHDDLSTNLSGIALLAERTATRLRSDTELDVPVRIIHETSRAMLEDLRDLVWLVDPSNDTAEGLVLKMRTAAESLLGEKFTLRVEGTPSLHRLRMTERRELLFIYKELLHNAARHAEAETVAIELEASDSRLVLAVADDGAGFDPDLVTPGNGLPSIQDRAQRLGGTLRIDSAPGLGTRATFDRSY